MMEAEAQAIVDALVLWRERGAGVWHPHMLAVWDRAIVAVNDLKVKIHLEADHASGGAMMHPALAQQIETMQHEVRQLKPEAGRPDLLFRLDILDQTLALLRDSVNRMP